MTTGSAVQQTSPCNVYYAEQLHNLYHYVLCVSLVWVSMLYNRFYTWRWKYSVLIIFWMDLMESHWNCVGPWFTFCFIFFSYEANSFTVENSNHSEHSAAFYTSFSAGMSERKCMFMPGNVYIFIMWSRNDWLSTYKSCALTHEQKNDTALSVNSQLSHGLQWKYIK